MSWGSWLVAAPIVLPLLSAAALLCLPRTHLQRTVSTVSSALLLALSGALLWRVFTGGIVVAQMGDWAAPFGVSLVADHLSAIMVLITGVMAFAVALYARRDIGEPLERRGYHPLFQVLVAGISGAFLTGDLFNLYVWFEVLLIASFVLLTLGGSRAQLRGGVHYVTINLLSSALFLSAIGLLYGMTGTLNMADLVGKLGTLPPELVTAVAMLFLVAFGIKAAIFPLFFWLPSSYHTPPIAISAMFAGMLTKVGVYALIRTFTLLFTQDVGYTHTLLLWLAALTMLTGVLGAAAQNDVRRILGFHIISQIGYMLMGLALFTTLSLVGAVFYLVHHIIVKANLFLIAGIIEREAGSYDLDELGGLYKGRPLLAALFLIPAFSLAGFPPLSGFWAKLIVIQAGLEAGAYAIVAVSLVVGLVTIYSMTKIWRAAFWEPHPTGLVAPSSRQTLRPLYVPAVGLAALTLLIGFWTTPFYTLAETAAEGLLEPSRYVEAVLGTPVAEPVLQQPVLELKVPVGQVGQP